MRIGDVTRSYGMYPFMTRMSVGDRPVSAIVQSPLLREVSEEDTMQPYPISMYGRNGAITERGAVSAREERPQMGLSVYA